MVVIGGGVIGCELGSVYARLGTNVTIVEYMPSLIAGMDADLGRNLQRSLKKIGVKLYLNYGVTKVSATSRQVTIKAKGNKKGDEITLKSDYCLVSVGRRPYTDGLGLEKLGISPDERGRIPVNEHLETAVSGIYAIGDVIKGAMLAHQSRRRGCFLLPKP